MDFKGERAVANAYVHANWQKGRPNSTLQLIKFEIPCRAVDDQPGMWKHIIRTLYLYSVYISEHYYIYGELPMRDPAS